MKHETVHELLTLRLYDEASAEESELLERHLEGCEDCRAFARELEGTLGALKEQGESQRPDELPTDWDERLRSATKPPVRRRLRPLVAFAAGLAAGLFLMGSLSPEVPRKPRESITGGPEFVTRSTPPPRATSGGTLAQLPGILRD